MVNFSSDLHVLLSAVGDSISPSAKWGTASQDFQYVASFPVKNTQKGQMFFVFFL